MADSSTFEWAATQLEATSHLSKLSCRGLMRHLFNQAGLSPETVTPTQWVIVVRKLLPDALKKHGVANIDEVVTEMLKPPKDLHSSMTSSIEAIFARMAT